MPRAIGPFQLNPVILDLLFEDFFLFPLRFLVRHVDIGDPRADHQADRVFRQLPRIGDAAADRNHVAIPLQSQLESGVAGRLATDHRLFELVSRLIGGLQASGNEFLGVDFPVGRGFLDPEPDHDGGTAANGDAILVQWSQLHLPHSANGEMHAPRCGNREMAKPRLLIENGKLGSGGWKRGGGAADRCQQGGESTDLSHGINQDQLAREGPAKNHTSQAHR